MFSIASLCSLYLAYITVLTRSNSIVNAFNYPNDEANSADDYFYAALATGISDLQIYNY